MSNVTTASNGTVALTDAPSSAPSMFIASPVMPTYYAPSTSQIVMYIVITSIIIVVITFLNRRIPRTASNASGNDATAAATSDANASQQDQVDLVKSMTPEERKEYVTNFLRTQKFVDDQDHSNNSSVSFRVAKSSSFRMSDNLNDDDGCADLESNIPDTGIPSSEKVAPGCAICLDRFKNGEDICCAQNQECPHEFHLECLFPWLLKSQDCPCCRRDYLSIETSPTEDTIVTENATR